jgi:hemin uptake protein HemP
MRITIEFRNGTMCNMRSRDPTLKTRQKERDVANRPAPLNSSDLFRGETRIEIEHQGELYRLQITRQGKLILTK